MDDAKADQIIALLSEMRNWLRVGFASEAKRTLELVLNDERKKIAYQLTDGTATIEQVRKAASMSPNTLLQLYNKCMEAGLMSMTVDKRRKRLFDLEALGVRLENQKIEE